ncbi:thioredoxin family protein [Microvirga sp. STR05]|uniref:Thioredoxin family protein n=1 Tax=Hymenobacter duratus TaxID=2771356 RepID=A0ABR8JHP6_9BACT|nr:thioredoxin family protein [Hymenobacter duratus]MBD2714069.1 thioredoxin family protein [Hymenobacter duratus]MBR7948971.1 thioredoxin family protein [Microvirga sp. STR05]
MRILTFCLLFLLSFTGARAQVPTGISWNTDLVQALQQAKATNKPVLAVFSGSDWCKPCIMLKQEVFDKPEFAQFAKDRFVLARFDFPRSKKNKLSGEQTKVNEQAAAQLNKEGAFPLVVLLSPEGKVLAKTGYRPGGVAAYDAYLTQLLTTK